MLKQERCFIAFTSVKSLDYHWNMLKKERCFIAFTSVKSLDYHWNMLKQERCFIAFTGWETNFIAEIIKKLLRRKIKGAKILNTSMPEIPTCSL